MPDSDETEMREQNGWDYFESLIEIGHRMAGSASERKAAEFAHDAFDKIGVENTRIEEFEFDGWTYESSSVEAGDSSHESVGLINSPDRSTTGVLNDVGFGLPSDFEEANIKGDVVIVSSTEPECFFRSMHTVEKYRHAVENGAVGFIYQNHLNGCLARSSLVIGKEGVTGEIPAVGVSKEVGARLTRKHEGKPVTVRSDTNNRKMTSQNVHAQLGPATPTEILVTCHLDGHSVSEGALDNAVGTAAVIEMANKLSEREDELETRIHFVAYGAEEFGLLGSNYHSEKIELSKIKANIQNDGIGRARNLRIHTNGFEELHDVVENMDFNIQSPMNIIPDITLISDHWSFSKNGVPSLLIASEDGDGKTSFGSTNGYVLTPADTFEKVDPRDFDEHSSLVTELVIKLSKAELTLPHKDRKTINQQIEQEGKGLLSEIISHPTK